MTDAEKELKRLNAEKLKKVGKNSIKGKILKASKKSALPRFCGGKSKPYSRKK
jgi:hypothetical protein|tara:strand:- start:470 stop:628 length:159 start_codon:yes stop_codon:yes gene_type:complete